MPFQEAGIAKLAAKMIVSGLLGMIGGIAEFFYEVDNERRRFTWLGILCMSAVAFVAGVIAGEMIPEGKYYYYGIIMMAGVNAYPVLHYTRKQFSKIARKNLGG